MRSRFERDTVVTRLDERCFEGRMDRGWWIVEGPNGGYVAAILLRALTLAVGDSARSPCSLTVYYTERPTPGPVEIEAQVERSGGSLTVSSARMRQGDRLVALALGAFSRPRQGPEFQHAAPPDVTPPENLEPPIFGDEDLIPIHRRYDYRWVTPEQRPSQPARARSGGWVRLSDPCLADYPVVAALADALPPAFFAAVPPDEHFRGIPTVELSVYFRAPLPLRGARPDDFLLAVFESRVLQKGFIEEDGEIWSRDGVLMAQSRQLALLL